MLKSKVTNSIFSLSCAGVIALVPFARAFAEDWSMFRGPNGSGVSTSTGLPEDFGPEKNVVWKTALPPGHSSPVLTKDRIFVTAFERTKSSRPQKTANSHAGTPSRTPAKGH